MVRAGEAGGVLEVVMGKLAEFLETSKTVRDQVVSALVYPLILLTFSGISVTILFTVVLPRFTGIFDDLGQTIPLPARVLLGISGFLTSYGLILLAVCTAGGVLVYRFLKTDRGRRWLDGRILALFPELTGRFHAARLGRTLGTLLKSGVPLLQALGNSRDVLSNRVVSDAMATVISRAREGEGIAAPLARTECFPTLAVSMIRVGEETGRLDEMLLKVAATFEKSLYVTIRRLLSLVEPLMIVLMALVVGSILAVMVYTVFSVNDLPF
jgi:general secretion pathway protein F